MTFGSFNDAKEGNSPRFSHSLQRVETLASRTFGEENLLRLLVPDDHYDADQDSKEAWRKYINGGLEVLGKKFVFLCHKCACPSTA